MIDINFNALETIGNAYHNHTEFLDLARHILEEFVRELSKYTTIKMRVAV